MDPTPGEYRMSFRSFIQAQIQANKAAVQQSRGADGPIATSRQRQFQSLPMGTPSGGSGVGNTAGPGPAGPTGNTGTRGSLWYLNAGAPTAILGELSGDCCLDSTTGNVYEYNGTTWVFVLNLIGPEGIPGTRGTIWFVGTTAPSGVTGVIANDIYLDTTNGNLYQYTDDAWVLLMCIIGPQGIPGLTGSAGELPFVYDSSGVPNLIAIAGSLPNMAPGSLDSGYSLSIQVANTNTGPTKLAIAEDAMPASGSDIIQGLVLQSQLVTDNTSDIVFAIFAGTCAYEWLSAKIAYWVANPGVPAPLFIQGDHEVATGDTAFVFANACTIVINNVTITNDYSYSLFRDITTASDAAMMGSRGYIAGDAIITEAGGDTYCFRGGILLTGTLTALDGVHPVTLTIPQAAGSCYAGYSVSLIILPDSQVTGPGQSAKQLWSNIGNASIPSFPLQKYAEGVLTDLDAGDIVAGQIIFVAFNTSRGARWQLLSPIADPSSGGLTQVNSDWDATSGVAEILNKPTIPSGIAQGSAETDVALVAGQAVYINASSGHLGLATATDGTASQCAGLALTGGAMSTAVTFSAATLLTLSDWTALIGASNLASGSIYYIDPANPGGLTPIAPTTVGQWVVRIGVAVNTTTLDIAVQPAMGL